jgi:hypothetical protein
MMMDLLKFLQKIEKMGASEITIPNINLQEEEEEEELFFFLKSNKRKKISEEEQEEDKFLKNKNKNKYS